MSRRRRIYEGKAKVLYEGPEPGTLIQHFKDDATAFNAKKHEVIEGKGVLNNRISEYVFQHLNDIGVPTHFIRRLNMREQLIREVEIIPLEVVVRNVAAGSLATRLGIEEGTQLPRSIIEFYYKNDALNDPMVSEEHITAFGWATPQEIDDMMALAIRVNDFLSGLFLGVGIRLVDFKMECGRLWENEMMRIVVADEISPDSLPAVGHQVEREARQGPFPPRHGRPGRGLYRSRQAPRHHERGRAAARHRPGAGEGLMRCGKRGSLLDGGASPSRFDCAVDDVASALRAVVRFCDRGEARGRAVHASPVFRSEPPAAGVDGDEPHVSRSSSARREAVRSIDACGEQSDVAVTQACCHPRRATCRRSKR